MKKGLLLFFHIIILFHFYDTRSQEITVNINPKKVSIGGQLKISLNIENEQIKSYGEFPEIDGFSKTGISSSSSTNFINGKRSSSQSIIQNYIAKETGVFNIPDFNIKVNNKNIFVSGTVVEVDDSYDEPKQSPFNNFFDPFDDPFDNFFERNNNEFYEVEADAFLSLNTDKKSVYVGEAFNTTLSFFVSESNVADMRFYELGRQLTEIIKKIKPSNCWEENFNIENINSTPVIINNKRYNQYKIFEATYYPFNNENIYFPKLELELIKYKVSKRPSFFGRNKMEDYEKFNSKPVEVKVIDLPDHPLKDEVVVGNFRLREKINKEKLKTGESFNYDFEIVGEGNISSIKEPEINKNSIDFYSPNSQQIINREKSKVFGSKKFSYYAIPNEPGNYNLSDNIIWIYFNSNKKKYDTLKTNITLSVTGEIKDRINKNNSDLTSIISLIKSKPNNLKSNKKQVDISIFLNIIILTLLVITSFYLILSRK